MHCFYQLVLWFLCTAAGCQEAVSPAPEPQVPQAVTDAVRRIEEAGNKRDQATTKAREALRKAIEAALSGVRRRQGGGSALEKAKDAGELEQDLAALDGAFVMPQSRLVRSAAAAFERHLHLHDLEPAHQEDHGHHHPDRRRRRAFPVPDRPPIGRELLQNLGPENGRPGPALVQPGSRPLPPASRLSRSSVQIRMLVSKNPRVTVDLRRHRPASACGHPNGQDVRVAAAGRVDADPVRTDSVRSQVKTPYGSTTHCTPAVRPGLVYTQQLDMLSIMLPRLPDDVQTLHAELVAMLVALEGDRSWSHLSGSFSTKTVAGHQYLYFQYSDPGGHRRQLAIGRQTDALRRILRRQQTDRTAVEQERAAIERLAELLRVGGASTLPHAVGRVLRALADAALFRLGGVLVGSYAFFLLGNLLGVHWPEAAWRTQDVDLASHVQIATTTATADVPATLSSLQMGFVPVPQLDPRHPSTSFKVRGKELRVDLLTPGRDGQDAPVFIPRLQAAAAPIKYLSLLMDEAQPAPAISGRGTTLVVVPTPARFALHKLLVSQTRSLVQQTKSGKDLQQAALLLEVLAEDRPTDIEVAARGFAKAGPAVTSKVLRALATVERRSPDAAAGVELARAALHS